MINQPEPASCSDNAVVQGMHVLAINMLTSGYTTGDPTQPFLHVQPFRVVANS